MIITDKIINFLKNETTKNLINQDTPDSWEYFFNHWIRENYLSSLDVSKICKMFLDSKINFFNKIKFIPQYCFYLRDDITSFIIPSNIETIQTNAFYGCKNLNYLYIPKSIKTIGSWAFSNCPLSTMNVEYEGTEKEYNKIRASMFSAAIDFKNITFLGR